MSGRRYVVASSRVGYGVGYFGTLGVALVFAAVALMMIGRVAYLLVDGLLGVIA